MPEDRPRWIYYVFLIMITEVGAIFILREITTEVLLIISGAVILLMILMVCYIVIYLIIPYLTSSSSSDYAEDLGYRTPAEIVSRDLGSREQHSALENAISEFQRMGQVITDGFHPQQGTEEEALKHQLLNFLTTRFPHHQIVQPGQESQGAYADIVVDGTFVFNLCLVSNQGKLIFASDRILKVKKDFSDIAMVFIDPGVVPAYILSEYARQFESAGINVIIKKFRLSE